MHSFARSFVVLACSLPTLFLFSCSHDKNNSSDNHYTAQAETPAPAIDPAKIPALKTQNFPPQWEKTPRNVCVVGKPFYDTLLAVDPEGSPVIYSLSKGPQGLTLDTQSGVVRFFPKTPGVFAIEVQASDTSQFSTKMEYELTASAPNIKMPGPKPTVIPNVPSVVAPGKRPADIVVRAEKPAIAPAVPPKPPLVSCGGPYQSHVNKPIDLNGAVKDPDNRTVKYDWDFMGKGQYEWSSPTSGKVRHSYTKSGVYKAVLKVTTNDGKQWRDTTSITIVNTPPQAHAGKPILSKNGRTIKLKGTGEDADGRIVLYEWDFNGDGTYDWSSTKNGIVKHEFDSYSHAILRVTDDDGATATDTLRVVICPEGMESVENGPYCIDAYEWPNISGKEPEREMTYFDAEKKCLGAGKHLCTSQEWENACMGNERQEYPKSLSPAVQTCNVIGNRYYPNKVAPSGAFPDCKSPVGAYDMNGNVAEWTQGGGVDSAFVYGGSWHHDLGFTTCSSKLPLQKSKGYFYVGFRCCK